jgi:hypothetical protein
MLLNGVLHVFPILSVVPVVAVVDCLDAMQLHRTALMRRTRRRTSSQRNPWELVVVFSFAALLSCGCILDMTLDDVSLLILRCNYNSSA